MSDLFPLRSRPGAEVRIRLRCNTCEVAWSGPRESSCWVCGEEGTALLPALASRASSLSDFERDLAV